MRVRVAPTKRIRVLGVDERAIDNIVWCSASMDISKLFWIDGYVLCLETYEKAFEHELEKGVFPINQVCYAKYPTYERMYDVGRGVQIPIIDVSDMKIFQAILNALKSSTAKP